MDLHWICVVSLSAVCSLMYPLFLMLSGIRHCWVFLRGDILILCYSSYVNFIVYCNM